MNEHFTLWMERFLKSLLDKMTSLFDVNIYIYIYRERERERERERGSLV